MKRAVLLVLLALVAVAPSWPQVERLGLPTPREFFKPYDVDAEAQKLLQEFLASLDPQTRAIITKLAQEASINGPPDIPKEQVKAFIQSTEWKKRERELLNQFVYRAQVLDLIPPDMVEFWKPIVFDAFVYFLGHLSEDRLFELVWRMGHLPQDAPRGDKIVAFTNKIPTFQKLAQIIARNPAIPPDIRQSLQILENSVGTMTRDELVAYIKEQMGEERLKASEIEFDKDILAEGSIGAVIGVRGRFPGMTQPDDAVIKVVKPYALTGLPEEMKIIDSMTLYFEDNAAHYGLVDVPITNMFRDIRAALEKEILVKEEKANLKRAAEYSRPNPRVHVPWTVEIGAENLIVMEFVHGQKITDSFPGDREKRAVMARRLYDALTYDPVYGGQETTLFHGDPHAGNVFHVTDNPQNPFQIALLDWGLMGTFTKKQRKQLVQLFLGLEFKHRKRMRNNVAGLLEDDLPQDPEKLQRLDEIFEEVFKMEDVKSGYEQLAKMVELLVKEGYKLDSQFGLFVKSQVTIVGILAELDPDFDQIAYSKKRVRSQVKRELPKRLLLLPAWNYHGYKSMMSNEDVKDYVFK